MAEKVVLLPHLLCSSIPGAQVAGSLLVSGECLLVYDYVMVTIPLLWTGGDWLMFIYAACVSACSLLLHPCIIILSMMDCPGAVVHPTPVQECSDMRD